MSRVLPSSLLRFGLRLDAMISLASGVMLCAAPALWAPALQLSDQLLLVAGLICLPYAAVTHLMSRARALNSIGVIAVIVGNMLWADAALLLAIGYGAEPSRFGQVFLAAHVLATGSFAVLQFLGLRRSERIDTALATAR